jgi:multicomponent Na+:H+ antiporter subunit G
MSLAIELLKALLLVAGCFFVLVSAVGLVRMDGFPARMQAAGKAAAMGLGLLLTAVAVDAADWVVAFKGLLAMGLLFLTLPIASHALMRTWWRQDGGGSHGKPPLQDRG